MPVRVKKSAKSDFKVYWLKTIYKNPAWVSQFNTKNWGACSPEIQKAPFQVPETRWGVA